MIDFVNVRAAITGGASGIGYALAAALVARGARVAIADLAEAEVLAAARALGDNAARAYRCDVTSGKDVDAFATDVARDFGGVDLVFANAGVWAGAKLHQTDPKEFDWLFDVNVRGVFNTIRAFAPLLIGRAGSGSPRFIITGSENSVGLPLAGINTAYTATKHALLAMADGLRRDLKEDGVAVSILCPGAVNTRIWDGARARHDRYGGPASMEPEAADNVRSILADIGQPPEITARLCLEGIAEDQFMIIADPAIRAFAPLRHREVEAALDRVDSKLH